MCIHGIALILQEVFDLLSSRKMMTNVTCCRVVSFLVDLTDWLLRRHHERLFPEDIVLHNDLKVGSCCMCAAVVLNPQLQPSSIASPFM